ncbi:cytochrome c oxidase subunit 2A [Macrococcus brunensis]|uniref:cytochrome c oxidase subunit 2A n=1 Tax=Macrococcus brunensis TaxID=198483 RepID=UPI001EEFADC2|nr:cytochrome c oxidase subunit 2A [Macrococcus brunensis]ULG73331.1 cytochrome c oxidase subunit 2A [Macrococcus brunensis]
MAKDKDQIKAEQQELAPEYDSHDNLDLRGTMVSVLTLGAIFVVLWFAIFILFIERI